MAEDVLITPASRKIEWYGSDDLLDAKIETDASGNLSIANPGGDISIGDTTADVYIGDGINNVNIVFEQDGSIYGTTGVNVTLGAADSSIKMGTTLDLNSNNIANINSATFGTILNIVTGSTSLSTTSTTSIDTTSATAYRTIKYIVQITQGTSFQSSEVLINHNGTTAYITEYAVLKTGSTLATLSTDISGGNVRLLVTMGGAASATIKFSKNAIVV
jgi:hypothetical protein